MLVVVVLIDGFAAVPIRFVAPANIFSRYHERQELGEQIGNSSKRRGERKIDFVREEFLDSHSRTTNAHVTLSKQMSYRKKLSRANWVQKPKGRGGSPSLWGISKWPLSLASTVKQQAGAGEPRFRLLQFRNVQELNAKSFAFDSHSRLRKRCGEYD